MSLLACLPAPTPRPPTGLLLGGDWAPSLVAAAFPRAARTLLSSPLFPLAGCVSHPVRDELQGPLVLRDLELLHGSPLTRGKVTHLSDHVPHEPGALGEAPEAVAAVPWLAHVLCHLAAHNKAHGHRVAQSHRCWSSMAAAMDCFHSIEFSLKKCVSSSNYLKLKGGRVLALIKLSMDHVNYSIFYLYYSTV